MDQRVFRLRMKWAFLKNNANMQKKESQSADKGWPSGLGFDSENNNLSQ
jgi:hypothetical protein